VTGGCVYTQLLPQLCSRVLKPWVMGVAGCFGWKVSGSRCPWVVALSPWMRLWGWHTHSHLCCSHRLNPELAARLVPLQASDEEAATRGARLGAALANRLNDNGQGWTLKVDL